jgi:hypothetical protein
MKIEDVEDLIQSYKQTYRQENFFVKILRAIPEVSWVISIKKVKELKKVLTIDEINCNPHFKAKKLKTKHYNSETLINWLNDIKQLGNGFKDLVLHKYFQPRILKSKVKRKREQEPENFKIQKLNQTIELENSKDFMEIFKETFISDQVDLTKKTLVQNESEISSKKETILFPLGFGEEETLAPSGFGEEETLAPSGFGDNQETCPDEEKFYSEIETLTKLDEKSSTSKKKSKNKFLNFSQYF